MVEYTDKVVLELQAKMDKYHADIMKGQRTFDQAMGRMEKSLNSVESTSVRAFSRMTTALTAFAGAVGINEIRAMADTWTDYSSRVGLAIRDMDAAPIVMERLYVMAQRTYSEFGTTVDGFLSFSTSLREIGLTTEQSLSFVEAFNNAMVVSGAKAERARQVQDALSKAMASGTLRGDELNSVIQSGGRFAELLADHFHTTVGGLRDVGQAGKITGDVIQDVLTKNFQTLQEEAESMPATITDGLMKIQNAVMRWVGTMDQATGTSAMLASVLVAISDNFEAVGTGAAAAAAVVMAGYVPSLARAAIAQAAVVATNPFLLMAALIGAAVGALAMFGNEMTVVEGSMASLNDYIVVAWQAIMDGVGVASDYLSTAFNNVVDGITEDLEGTGLSWQGMLDTVRSVVNTVVGVLVGLRNTAVDLFKAIPNVVAEGVIGAMIYMVEKIQEYLNKVVTDINFLIEVLNNIPGVDIGPMSDVEFANNLENPFAGATADMKDAVVKGFEEALSRDYVGEVGSAIGEAITGPLEEWERRANQNALVRNASAAIDRAEAEIALNKPPGKTPTTPGGGAGGKGSKDSKNSYEKELEAMRLRVQSMREEAKALEQLNPYAADYEEAVASMRIEQELLNKARESGIAITPELLSGIQKMAAGYREAEKALEDLREKQELGSKQMEDWEKTADDAQKGFIRDMIEGKSATEALAGAMQKLADKLLDLALDSLFSGGLGGGGGGFGGLLQGIAGFFGFRARGGGTQAGSPYFINENTPNSELFIPSKNGAVLNVPQAQQALRDAYGAANAASASDLSGRVGQVSHYTSTSHITIDVAGANGDAAIEAAVNRGIQKAAPVIERRAIGKSVSEVGRLSRTGSKDYLGI